MLICTLNSYLPINSWRSSRIAGNTVCLRKRKISFSCVWFIICSKRSFHLSPVQKILVGLTLVSKYFLSAFKPFHKLKHINNINIAKGNATNSVIVCRLAKPPDCIKTMATVDINTPHITACQRGAARLLSRDAMLFNT